MKVGISGTMGAGKSSVARYIESKGYIVYDADMMVHELYDTLLMQDYLLSRFGPEIMDVNGVNRKVLASKVFTDKQALADLEGKVYPLVRQRIEMLTGSLVFVEVPLLFEANFTDLFDIILVVVADDNLRYERMVKRGLTLDDIMRRDARQMSHDEKVERATYVINNSFDLESLYRNVDRFLERIEHE